MRLPVAGEFGLVREALVEAVEDEGLTISGRLGVGELMARTGKDFGKGASPIREAEVVQFCSARLAWQMAEEDPSLLANCPLAVTLVTTVAAPGWVVLVYRAPDGDSPPQKARLELLERIVGRAVASLPLPAARP